MQHKEKLQLKEVENQNKLFKKYRGAGTVLARMEKLGGDAHIAPTNKKSQRTLKAIELITKSE